MRRQSFYIFLLAVLLLVLPIVNDSAVRFGIFDYVADASSFVRLLLDPQFIAEPIQFKTLAAIYLMQSIGWIVFAVTLALVALVGIIRNKGFLKYAMIAGILVLLHGVLEVILAVSLGSVSVLNAIFTRFGIDFSDFIDDYDALFNSTLVPIGIIVWYIVTKKKKAPRHDDVAVSSNQVSTENV